MFGMPTYTSLVPALSCLKNAKKNSASSAGYLLANLGKEPL